MTDGDPDYVGCALSVVGEFEELLGVLPSFMVATPSVAAVLHSSGYFHGVEIVERPEQPGNPHEISGYWHDAALSTHSISSSP